MSEELARAIAELNRDEAFDMVKRRIEKGEDPLLRQADPDMDIDEALARRDFTINAMAWDPDTLELRDPFNGRADLAAHVLRHASDRFTEDPLRVLRGMHLAARFELTPAPETVELSKTLSQDGQPNERLWEEWKQLLVQGIKPSLGLTFLRDTGWLRFYPELAALKGCEQDPLWHPEGDVWIHTLHCLDWFARQRTGRREDDLLVGLAIRCHDFGKPLTTRTDNGRITSRGHERVFHFALGDVKGNLLNFGNAGAIWFLSGILQEINCQSPGARRVQRSVGCMGE